MNADDLIFLVGKLTCQTELLNAKLVEIQKENEELKGQLAALNAKNEK